MGVHEVVKALVDPINKLLEVSAKGIGKIYEPIATRKQADADAYRLRTIGKATTETQIISKELEMNFLERTQKRLNYQDAKRQFNLESVIDVAYEQLSQEKLVSEEKLNDDWITRYFNIVQDVSEVEMQKIWGRILAGEIQNPSTYSVRLLDVLKNMSKEEAKMFERIVKLSLSSGKEMQFVFKSDIRGDNLQKYINLSDILTLGDLGLIRTDRDLVFSLTSQENTNGFMTKLLYGALGLSVILNQGKRLEIPVYIFTKIGTELSNLIYPFEGNMEYLKEFHLYLKKHNADLFYLRMEFDSGHIVGGDKEWHPFNSSENE